MKNTTMTILASSVLAGLALASPAAADHLTDQPHYSFTDIRGDAPAQADLLGGSVAHHFDSDRIVRYRSRVQDVRGSGRYEVFLNHDTGFGVPRYAIATLVKEAGRAPRTTFVWKQGATGTWQRKTCALHPYWNERLEFASMGVPMAQCGPTADSNWDLTQVRVTSGGATDVADGRLFPPTFDRHYYDAAGDAAAQSDIGRLRHVKTADHVAFSVQVADLPDHGRFVAETSADSRHTRVTVLKEAGKAPVASVALSKFGSWSRVECRPAAIWNASTNQVVVHVGRSTTRGADCAQAYDGAQEPLHYGLVEVGGTRDVIRY